MATPFETGRKHRTVQGHSFQSLAMLIFVIAVGGHGLRPVVAEELGANAHKPNIVVILSDDK